MQLKLQWVISEKEHGALLRDFLRNEKNISKKALADVKFRGTIHVNGEHATVRETLCRGDVVTIYFPQEKRSSAVLPKAISFSTLYEDDHFLIVNKQAGLPTIPSREHPEHSLANGVLAYYDQQNIQGTFHAVNRLDKDTSGIVLIAKHRYAHDLLAKQQKKGELQRKYVAVVHGKITTAKGTIDAPIGRVHSSIITREVRSDGQRAVTHFHVLKTLAEESVVALQLETGRTHQIRVHLSHIGHPLLGDDLYGGKKEKIARQALHSNEVSFYHPFEEKQQIITAPLPDDLKQWFDK